MQVNIFFLYILTNKQAFVRIYSDVTCPAVSPSDLPVHDCKSSFNYTCGEMRGTVSCHDGRCAALDGVYDCGGGRAEAVDGVDAVDCDRQRSCVVLEGHFRCGGRGGGLCRPVRLVGGGCQRRCRSARLAAAANLVVASRDRTAVAKCDESSVS